MMDDMLPKFDMASVKRKSEGCEECRVGGGEGGDLRPMGLEPGLGTFGAI